MHRGDDIGAAAQHLDDDVAVEDDAGQRRGFMRCVSARVRLTYSWASPTAS